MKKIIIALVLTNLLVVPALAMGSNTSIMPPTSASLAGNIGNVSMADTPIDQALNRVANYMIGILIAMSVFYVIWAGYTFVMSAGDPEKVGEARKRIMFAGIGVVVALIAKGIVSLVLAAIKTP
jgi:hypothetical protein